MSANRAKEVKVSVKSKKPRHPSSLSIGFAVGSMPSVTITYPPGNRKAQDRAMDITSQDIFKQLQRAQEYSFDTKKELIRIRVKGDGNSGWIKFEGSISCPTYVFSVGTTLASENVMSRFATMNATDLSIYKMNPKYLVTNDIPSTNVKKLNKAILAIFDFLTKKAKKEKPTEQKQKKAVTTTSEINRKQIPYIRRLLKNSKDMGWDNLYKILGRAGWNQCKMRIIDILRSNTGGFFNAILQLADEFQCIYVPGVNGKDPGKLVNKLKIFEKTKTLKLNAISLNASIGSRGMYPPGAVAVVSPTPPNKYLTTGVQKAYFVYPDTGESVTKSATMIQVPGPPWLSPSVYEVANKMVVRENLRKSGQSIGKRRTYRTKAKSKVRKKLKDVTDIMLQWAKAIYYWQALGQTSCVVNCEFRNIEIGKAYVVRSGDGKRLFTGFLYGITHNIVSEVDSAAATTMLNFSHIRMGTAKIPGIK